MSCRSEQRNNQSAYSPSNFARTNFERYEIWAHSANISLNDVVPPSVFQEYRPLTKLIVPSKLLSTLAAITAHPHDKHQKVFADDLLRRLQDPNIDRTDADDVNDMVHNWTCIARAHEKISECNRDTNEATLRKGVDDLLYLSRGKSGAKVLFEMSVRLRASSAAEIPSPVATADTVILHPMPPSLTALLSKRVRIPLVYHAFWRNPVSLENNHMDFLMSAAEYKLASEGHAFRQLVYHLSTAQSVRRALDLSDVTLYGWTSAKFYGIVYMALYACWWSESKICFSDVLQTFNLSEPLSCLTFYNFLCNLNTRNAAIVKTDSDNDFKDVVTLLMNGQWRAPDQKRKSNECHIQNSRDAPGDTMEESPGIDELEDSLSDGASDVSNDFPTTEENIHEVNQILGNNGEEKERHGRVFGTTIDWIEKFVPKTNWTERFVVHRAADSSILTDNDFLLEVPYVKTIIF